MRSAAISWVVCLTPYIRMGTNTCLLLAHVDLWASITLLLPGACLAVHVSAVLFGAVSLHRCMDCLNNFLNCIYSTLSKNLGDDQLFLQLSSSVQYAFLRCMKCSLLASPQTASLEPWGYCLFTDILQCVTLSLSCQQHFATVVFSCFTEGNQLKEKRPFSTVSLSLPGRLWVLTAISLLIH